MDDDVRAEFRVVVVAVGTLRLRQLLLDASPASPESAEAQCSESWLRCSQGVQGMERRERDGQRGRERKRGARETEEETET